MYDDPTTGKPSRPTGPDKQALLRPLRPGRNLTEEVVDRIAGEIRGGRLGPGARLPTEQELMAAMGVSRTVVREAVAALRAEGLVTTRQGAGAFVAADASRVPFRIDPDGLSSIGDVLEVMELRLAIEVEAAALAAERITPRAPRSHRAGACAPSRPPSAVAKAPSTRTSPSIARSPRPPATRALPSCSSSSAATSFRARACAYPWARRREQRQYLMRIQNEHARIHEAIRVGHSAEARKAMRTHLTRSLQRYRRLAERQLPAG